MYYDLKETQVEFCRNGCALWRRQLQTLQVTEDSYLAIIPLQQQTQCNFVYFIKSSLPDDQTTVEINRRKHVYNEMLTFYFTEQIEKKLFYSLSASGLIGEESRYLKLEQVVCSSQKKIGNIV